MATTIDFIRQTAPIEWLLSPLVIIAALSLIALVMTGVAGRLALEAETRLATRRSIGRPTARSHQVPSWRRSGRGLIAH